MKASEVLRLYEAGRRDFKGVSLRGQNFKGKDLSGADFSGADIRSTNFTNANLTGVDFSRAQAGLQRRWAVGLVVVSLLLLFFSGFLSGIAGAFVSVIFDSSNLDNQITGWISLVIIVVFLFLLFRNGIVSGALGLIGAFIIALVVVSIGVGTFPVFGVLAGAVVGVLTFSVVIIIVVTFTVAFAIAESEALVFTGALVFSGFAAFVGFGAAVSYGSGALAGIIAGIIAVAVVLVSTYVGWRSLKGDKRDAWIRSIAISLAAIGGNSFRGAMLTDADFSQAYLKSTDFRRAMLCRTRWRDAKKLDQIRSGETYLNNPQIRELVITGNGQGQFYGYLLNLTGIDLQGANLVKADFTGSILKNSNLQGADLTNASLIGANLNCASLQDVDLSGSRLVQTQLDEADLTGSTLTGAYIEDWNITTKTKLDGIRCAYVFMRLPPEGDLNRDPHRKPDDRNKVFLDGEFSDFIAPMVQTLDLYHNQVVDPRAFAIAFQDLREQNPDAVLEIVSMEKRGKQRDQLLVRAEVSQQSDLSKLHNQYFERYDYLLTLPSQAVQALLIQKEQEVQRLAGLVRTAVEQPSNQINNTYQTQGDTIVSEQGSNVSKYNFSNAQFAGGFAETVKGNQVGGTINNQASETPSLAEAAAEIQNLLKQLEASNPIATETEQTAFLNIMIPPTKRERFIGALKSAGGAAIEEIPYGPVLKALVEGWQRPEG
ncbi:pentapeptide repeat-containing protein [Leptothoe sp. EHU-05/26/07-4]